jgi:hypothetical protein
VYPSIAVACGSSIYMYRIFKSFFKFTLPNLEMIPEEKAAWLNYSFDKISLFTNELNQLKASDADLSYKSLDVIYDKVIFF